MNYPLYPSLYQINTRVWINQLSEKLERQATLDDIPDADLDRLSDCAFDWIWLLSVWQTGTMGRTVSRTQPEWNKEFLETLPDLKEEDIAGSGFAITAYRVHKDLGGDPALKRLRERLAKRGLKLMLDFVPNHTGIDHEWVSQYPHYYIQGNDADLAREPANYCRVNSESGNKVFAFGRDPYFPGWPDTLQLNYGNSALQEAMKKELERISGQCDGVRCDMAMLALPEVFERTWGIKSLPFWPAATGNIREKNPGFCFMAEVYWDLEWTLQQQGFDYTYDKRLYDRLHEGHPGPVREHFYAGMDFQNKLARFLENHDEPRAATAFTPEIHEAAAIITFLSPGLRFFHQGQFEGRKKRISPHIVRAPEEEMDFRLGKFYERLLEIIRLPVFRTGKWRLLEPRAAWDGNGSNDFFLAFSWESLDKERYVVAVNYSSSQGQCYLKLPWDDLKNSYWSLQDLFNGVGYTREGNLLQNEGLFLDEPGWSYYVFIMNKTLK